MSFYNQIVILSVAKDLCIWEWHDDGAEIHRSFVRKEHSLRMT